MEAHFSCFELTHGESLRFLHGVVDLCNKVRDIKRHRLCGKQFWDVVRELDAMKKDLAAFRVSAPKDPANTALFR